MAWLKRGRIFSPEGRSDWMHNSVLTPTPILISDEVVRVYASFRDAEGVGRIGFVDVSARSPSEILRISELPVIGLGRPGMFDDNGMLLGDVIRHQDEMRMYYVGFQLVRQAKFLAFTGAAVSYDGGETFTRVRETPIMDRAPGQRFIRAIHTVLPADDGFHIWYAAGDSWRSINGSDYPEYHIRYTHSRDGYSFSDEVGTCCLEPGVGEYRIGRPRVRRTGSGYEMRFTFDTLSKEYQTGVATSEDGIRWMRLPEHDLLPSGSGWEEREVSYPCVVETKYGMYVFYGGNSMGRDGFGYAEWRE